VITKDNVSVAVNATIFSQVVEPRLALFSVSNYLVAIDNQARTTLRAVFGSMTLDDALSQRERINAQLQAQMEAVTDKWGVRIHRIEIVDIVPPEQILRAMALQKTADQEKRAAILLSEGQQQSAINVAEGAKQAAIKNGEGERQAQILRAEGQKQAAILEAEGRSRAIDAVYSAIHDGHPDPELLAVLQLDTLSRFATAPMRRSSFPSNPRLCWGRRRPCGPCSMPSQWPTTHQRSRRWARSTTSTDGGAACQPRHACSCATRRILRWRSASGGLK